MPRGKRLAARTRISNRADQDWEADMSAAPIDSEVTEYIVVGSGAGGGTLAARLAESGATVTLIEAGGDPRDNGEGAPRVPEDYDVPAFHPYASENEDMKWDFFVRHYGDDERQKKDDKYRAEWQGKPVDGVLYPRAGTLGGCTAHNAMICVYPSNSDWDGIAELTGDPTWRADNMRRYFETLEDCQYRYARPWFAPLAQWLAKFGYNPSRHGWGGWLRTEVAIPPAALGDKKLVEVIADSVFEDLESRPDRGSILKGFKSGRGDPNDWRVVTGQSEGIRYTPLTTRNHARMGTRERVLEVASLFPDRLKIVTHALATKVIFDSSNKAIGIEYLKGAKLYRAHGTPSEAPGDLRQRHCSREVILAGGAFNTPQLLMLSGIGPTETLNQHGIEVKVPLEGVGKNLQDRYEVGVVNRMNFDHWHVLTGSDFTRNDPIFKQWETARQGVYTTNGAVLASITRSVPERPVPDLFCFALLGLFRGYFPGYSALFGEHLNYLTWAILKGHTQNRAGEVTLRSADPLDTPLINFRYFEEGSDTAAEDLQSVIEGIRFVRRLTQKLKEKGGPIAEEELPGDHLQTDDELADFIRDNAWGHHASCTCPIGTRESGGVLTSDFRVHGTRGLRIVDASVFPRIPGFFIVSAIYMIAEKAADVILQERSGRTS